MRVAWLMCPVPLMNRSFEPAIFVKYLRRR
jgi:hypothetical protein